MRKRNTWVAGVSLVIALGVMLSIASCATTGIKPWAQRSPQEKSLAFMQMYNAQFEDTMRQATSTGLTQSQKDMVNTKREGLAKVKPMIEMYDSLIVSGRMPSVELESTIIGLLDKLAASGG